MLRLFKNLFRQNKANGIGKEQNAENPKEIPDFTAAFVDFAINEDKMKRIALGRRKDKIFVCFQNPILSDFFKDWFAIMKMRVNNDITEESYIKFLDDISKRYCSKEKNVFQQNKKLTTDSSSATE